MAKLSSEGTLPSTGMKNLVAHCIIWFSGMVPLLAAALFLSRTRFGEHNKLLVLSLERSPSAMPADCTIDTSGSPWEQHCVKLSKVCVDQGTLILYEDQYQQVGLRKAGELPSIEVAPGRWYGDYMYPWRVGSTNRGFEVEAALKRKVAGTRHLLQPAYEVKDPSVPADEIRWLPPLRMRPASSMEPRDYLSDPTFSNCTIPVLWMTRWANNLWHAVHDSILQIYMALNETSWRDHIKLVVQTPEGLRSFETMQLMLETLTNMSVETVADFSTRLPLSYTPDQDPAAEDPSQPPRKPSYEGGQQRCFQQLFVCRNTTLGQPTHQYALGQHVLRQLQRRRLVPPSAPRCGAAAACQASNAGGAGQGGSSSKRVGAPQTVLRVGFQKRRLSREILNVRELITRCNEWQFEHPDGNASFRFECSEVEFPNLAAGASAAQELDVLIGIHGAGLTNSMFMQPGSSVVEIIPFQWDNDDWGSLLGRLNANDPTSRIQWWSIVVCNPDASKPGPMEELGLEAGPREGTSLWPRDRSANITWQAVERTLEHVIESGGNHTRYMRRYWNTTRWRLYMGANGVRHKPFSESGTCPEYRF